MHGAAARAAAKRSRTRRAPTPTYFSSNDEPLAAKNGTPASPATARARSVLPVPGCPSRRKPRGIFAPSRPKRSGSRRYSTTSTSSAFTSSTPSTSAKRSVAFVTVWYVELPAAVRFGLSSEPSAPPRPPRSLDAVSTRTDTHAASTLKTPRTTSSAKRSPSGSSCSRSGPAT